MTQAEVNELAAKMQACADKLADALDYYKLNGIWIKRTYPRNYRPVLQQIEKKQDLKAIGKALDALDA